MGAQSRAPTQPGDQADSLRAPPIPKNVNPNQKDMSMGVGDTPSMKRLREQARGLDIILGINGALRLVGLGSGELAETQQRLTELKSQMEQMADYPDRFNQYFAPDGWLAHGSLDFNVLKEAVDQYEAAGPEAGTAVLMRYFSPENLDGRLFFLNWAEELRVRRRLIHLAFDDYKAGRHHAVIPVLLMMIDGATNDAVGKGFHADGIELDVWDHMIAADGSIETIKDIFQRSRRKTRTEEISLPFRNGILHGMDLGYDNAVVAAKCWCFLFVVADWIVAKKSEGARQEKFEEEGRTPTWSELARRIAENERTKAALDAWSPRAVDLGYIDELNRGGAPDAESPEATAMEFLKLWAQRNFGGMSKLYWALANPGSGAHAGEVRGLLGDHAFSAYQIEAITDEAAGITMVDATLDQDGKGPTSCTIRLIYETPDGQVAVRGLTGGSWRLVWAQIGYTRSG